jgi:hypothetical protein
MLAKPFLDQGHPFSDAGCNDGRTTLAAGKRSGSEPWAKILDYLRYAQPATRQITDRSIHNGWFSPPLRVQAPDPLRLPYAVGCLGHPGTAWVFWAF